MCRMCKRRLATVIDHIRPVRKGGDIWDEDNLQPLCESCHNRKTNAENLHR